tara:strand:+ start:1169 stop:1447 length:279 start_codon:yes stop_codon:yes gene_type:complete
MWWLFFILFLIISVASSTLLFYAMKRINLYENMLVEIEQIIKFSSTKMKQVDGLGHYESDDETQFFFEQLKDMQKLLDSIFVKEESEEKKNG